MRSVLPKQEPARRLRIDGPKPQEYLMVFSALVVSVSWVADIGSNTIQYFFYVLAATGAILAGRLRFRSHFTYIAGGLVILTLFVVSMQNGMGERRNLVFLMNMVLAILMIGAFRGRSVAFMKSYLDIVYFLTLISLIVFPLLFFQHGLLVPVPDIALASDEGKLHRSLHTLFGVSYFVSNNLSAVWRNQSIFWEPGMMACFLVIALAVADALNAKRRRKVTLILGILTTFTPGGYAVFGVYLFFKAAAVLNRRQIFHLLLAVTVVAVAYISLPVIRDVVLFLFKRDIENDPSVLIRSTDFWLPFYSAAEAPLFGHPNFDQYQAAMLDAISRERGGMSNSLGEYFYRFGFVWSFVWLLAFASGLKRIPELPGYVFPVVVLILLYEPIGFSLFFIMFVFVGLNEASLTHIPRLFRGRRVLPTNRKLAIQ
jgi:hypothetical protein